MNIKILLFLGWLAAGWNATQLLALFVKYSPAIQLGVLFALLGFAAIASVVAWFAPSTRPWLALISVVIGLGGLVWLL
ncbi:hypothetical protein QUA41_30655 [Microcoleus sp. Pol11C1]|uniref:hypothetical protein n=1 Tax=unclassified Microcoleus TaxID=2642155 RepID=UPI002FD33F97